MFQGFKICLGTHSMAFTELPVSSHAWNNHLNSAVESGFCEYILH
jgi:hypothetical protein